MRVWRLCPEAYVTSALAGVGGLYASGRWHHKGHLVVYTSATPSLAALEALVHVDPALAPSDVRLIEIDVPEDLDVESCDPGGLATAWQAYPAPVELQDSGTRWLSSSRSAVLRVPAAVMPVESNYILNPKHSRFGSIRVVRELPFSFDSRLLHRHNS